MSYVIEKPKRNVDFVLCIDGTLSMSPLITAIQTNFYLFLSELYEWLAEKRVRPINTLRIKVIVFRDYRDDGADAMVESVFFNLPEDDADFEQFLMSITANGGGDLPENGLEALHYAMSSDFTAGRIDRQVIMLFTDADAIRLGLRGDCAGYPSDMVDEEGLIRAWGEKNYDWDADDVCTPEQKNRRMFLFAPPHTYYEYLSKTLRRCYFEPVEDMSTVFDKDSIPYLVDWMGRAIFY